MPLPIINLTYQVALVWQAAAAPRPASNILHFVDIVGTQNESDLFTDLQANVTAGMWSATSNTAGITQVNITQLDGVSAGQAFTPTPAAKWNGSAAGEMILQGATVVSLKSDQRGPRGRNRIYLPWIGEDQQTNGTIAAGTVTAMTAAWVAFETAMGVAGWQLTAVSGVHATENSVTSIAVRPYVKTQRRRARR